MSKGHDDDLERLVAKICLHGLDLVSLGYEVDRQFFRRVTVVVGQGAQSTAARLGCWQWHEASE